MSAMNRQQLVVLVNSMRLLSVDEYIHYVHAYICTYVIHEVATIYLCVLSCAVESALHFMLVPERSIVRRQANKSKVVLLFEREQRKSLCVVI
jgi:hypothetical protein